MAATTYMSTTGALSKIVREEIVPNMKEWEPKVDPFFSKAVLTAEGVKESDMGRGWLYLQTFVTGYTGAYKVAAAEGPTDIVRDLATTGQIQLMDETKLRTFPGASRQADQGYFQKSIGLVQGMGSIMFPLQYSMAGKLTAAIMDPVKIKMRNAVKGILKADANALYTEDADKKYYVRLNTGAVAASKATYSSNILTLTMDSTTLTTGRVHRLIPGTGVAWVDGATDAQLAYGFVISNDYLDTKIVKLWLNTDPTPADTDYIITSDSIQGSGVTYGTSGFSTWFKNSGTIYGVSLTTHPFLKSLIASLSGAVADETQLNKYVGAFYDAYGDMYSLDGALMSTGVLVALLDSFSGLGRYIRQDGGSGNALAPKMGWTRLGYVWQGEEFEFACSSSITPGVMYIWKFMNNIKKLIPPAPDGATSAPGFHRGVQFVAPFMGSRTIFLPYRVQASINESGSSSYTDVGALTEFQIAPYIYPHEYCPEQIPGIKLTSCAEITA